MVKVKVITRTATMTTETVEQRTATNELLLPSLEEITESLKEKIPCLSEEGTNFLARKIAELAKELKETPASGIFAKSFNPEKVNVRICAWDNSFTMFDRMRYPGDYSSILMPGIIETDGMEFYPVLVYNTKDLYIHFVK
ncbi:MAG: hypothetical protein HFJ44_06660 [Clostridia bacterium]|jgi:hypothetical protein|nr:hypothetical protein [Clostridia bacterium]